MDLVVDRATVDDIAKLEGKLDEMKAMVGNPEEFSRADLEFHVVLSEITRNSFIIKMEKLISGVFASVIESITEKSSEIYEKAISYHMGIVEAIKNRDKKLAKDIMIESIDEHQRQV
jgi:GntR family transcriptional repressor for pyruvate dehydrogenase complex